MKYHYYSLLASVLLCALLPACDADKMSQDMKASENSTNGIDINEAVTATTPMTEQQKVSYLLGVNLASGIPVDVLKLDISYVSQGIEDVINSRPLRIGEMELQKTLHQFNLVLKKYRDKQRLVQQHNYQNKVLSMRTSGEQFLLENRNRKGVSELSSGVQYKIVQSGKGDSPNANSRIRVHYAVSFVDDKNQIQEFDSSYKRGAPSTLSMQEVIPGWQEILPMMNEGSHWQLFIPANLAYGLPGITGGEVPLTATLIYELELIKVMSGS